MWFLIIVLALIAGLAIWMWKRDDPVTRDQANQYNSELFLETIDAQFELAQKLLLKDLPQEHERAYQILSDLVTQHDFLPAYLDLSFLALHGIGHSQDVDYAIQLLTQAHQLGDQDAAYRLATIYNQPDFARLDAEKAQYWYQHAIARHNLDAMYHMAVKYLHGDGVEQDIDKALNLIESTAQQQQRDAEFLWGSLLFHGQHVSQNTTLGLAFLKRAAAQHHVEATSFLMQFYSQYIGRQHHPEAAFEYIKAHALQDDPVACNQYALLVLKQRYDGQQRDQIITQLQQQAQQLDVDALNLLGYAHFAGLGVRHDEALAFQYWNQAAKTQDPLALCCIGHLYQQGIYVEQDHSKAVKLFEHAQSIRCTEYGSVCLALCYLYGQGVTANAQKVIQLLQPVFDQLFQIKIQSKADLFYGLALFFQHPTLMPNDVHSSQSYFHWAIEHGSVDAMYDVGMAYLNGSVSFEQNSTLALQYLQQAAVQQHVEAQIELARLYLFGIGTAKDEPCAAEWLQQAIKQNSPTAMNQLAEMYEKGWGVKQDFAQALELYHQAVALNDPAAHYHVGRLYAQGDGVAKNYAQARVWLEKARELGFTAAEEFEQSLEKLV